MKQTLFSFLAIALFAVGAVASAQTSTPTDTGDGTGASDATTQATPGAPSAGAGGDAMMNIAILVGSGLAALAGGVYLSRRLSH